jgi:hypothetical protein
MGLTGRYGFLSDFSSMNEMEARQRIQRLCENFGVQDFQFYDWAFSYSEATQGDHWTDAFLRSRPVSRATILTYIDEIHRLGGRAWAYVQAVGAEEYDLDYLKPHAFRLVDRSGRPYVHAGRFPCYFANAAWARFMVNRWAPDIMELGFDGIHWDTLGAIAGNYDAEKSGVLEFIQQSAELLPIFGLQQTMNFVSLAWWDPAVVQRFLTFPYVEVWSPEEEQKYYDQFHGGPLAGRRAVIAYYPSQDIPDGWDESQTMLARWEAAEHRGLSYLLVGDNLRRLHNEYFPNNRDLQSQEIRALQRAV